MTMINVKQNKIMSDVKVARKITNTASYAVLLFF